MTARIVGCLLFAIASYGSTPLSAVTSAYAGDPPVLKAPVEKCGAKMEYLSQIKSTGINPPYELKNMIRNTGDKVVTDVIWKKPDLSTSELAIGDTLEETYGISNFTHDKDAPISFWYQGCSAPAEAYLRQDQSAKKGLSLRSLLRKYSEASPDKAVAAEITVSVESEFIEFKIKSRPADAQVGLTAIDAWIKPETLKIAQASAKENGYTSGFIPPAKVLGTKLPEHMKQKWFFENALFTKRVSGNSDTVRIRFPISSSNVQIARGTIILVDDKANLIATGSYATFAPTK